jgi:hypothetical protein
MMVGPALTERILKIKLRLLRAGAPAGIEIKSLHLASMP